MDRRQLAARYLALQGLAGAAWWTWLALVPGARPRFSLPGDASPTVLVFALPDVALFVVGSLVASRAAARGRVWAPHAAWLVTGATAYAALWCVGATLQRGASPAGAALMLPAAAACAAAAAALSRR